MIDRFKDHIQSVPPTFVEDNVNTHVTKGHDFGFTDDQPITVHIDRKLLTDDQYNDKLTGLARLVDSLFDSLIGDPKKDYLYWPNRQEKINEWKQKINTFLSDKDSQ